MAIDKKKKEAVKTVVKITDAEEKKKALDTAIAYIEKQFGKGAIMKLGEAKAMDIEAIPTGSMTLDIWRLVLEECREEELLRYTDLSHQVRQRSHFMLSQKRRKWAVR